MGARLRNPAVVVNSETAGVGIIHSLSLGGVEIATVERSWPPALGRFSRFAKVRSLYRPRRGETLVDGLLALSRQFDGSGVLFPGTDADLEAMIEGYDRLAERYHVPAARHIGLRIFEKNWQYELAERTGVPVPRHTRFAGGLTPDIHGFRFPLILKPSSRASASGEQVFRLRVVANTAELDASLAEIGRDFPGREFQVGENIPGEPDQLYTVGAYCDRDGRMLRAYTGRKISQYPYYHGMASVAESVDVPPAVVAAARALLEEAHFHGICQVEFKHDARDGRYKLMEVNGRSWLWVKLAAFSGVNLPLIQYYDLTGDARLQAALEQPQRNDRFFVFDHHVKLNDMPAEQQRIRLLEHTKVMVPAIYYEGERCLGAVHYTLSFAKRLRRLRSLEPSAPGALPSSAPGVP